MKLPESSISAVKSSVGRNFSATMTMMESALSLAQDGWNVFPLRPGTKIPLIKKAHKKGDKCRGECGRDGHGAHDGTRDPDKIRRWWTSTPSAGIGANLGEDRIAFDIDVNHGGGFLVSFPDTRRHLSGRGNGNAHLIYQIEPGSVAATIRPAVAFAQGIDIRVGRGSYIVMPPTLHEETHRPYTADLVPEHVLTDDEVQAIFDEAGATMPAVSRGAKRGLSLVGGVATSRTMLSALLANPPAEGGRNEWLARVAGHYAKQYRDKRDLYDFHMMEANIKLTPPLEDDEYSKTIESIWETETAQHPEREASMENGYLVGNKRILFCQAMQQDVDGSKVMILEPWADFDIEALGVAVSDTDERMYWVRIYWRSRTMDATLDASILGDDNKLRRWLASRGPTFDPPFNAIPKTSPGVRLSRYLESQSPPQVNIVDTLGWHQNLEMFITHDGAITKDGPISKEDAGVVAAHQLVERGIAPYEYGFHGNWTEAQDVLREILTFQDEQAASVFGAWWAGTLLRPQIKERTSLFPIFGVEATSESGKTNGFFDMMVALNGNTRGQIIPTRPVLRDYSSANRNGIVWADDLDDLSAYEELLRASTSNGTASKMGMDNSGVNNTQIVSSILITGEALGMDSQKALMDRSIILNVESPKGRRSVKGDYPQWDDVLALQANYPKSQGGLTVLAGWYVQMALALEEETITAFKRAKRAGGTGRSAEKFAVLRAGAMLLDALCGHDGAWDGRGEHYMRVEGWLARGQGAAVGDKDNALTMKVLPWAVRTFRDQNPEHYRMGKYQGITTPVIVKANSQLDDDDELNANDAPKFELWVNIPNLAEAWRVSHGGRIDKRTETEQALQQQSNALPGEKARWVKKIDGRATAYRRMPDEYAKLIFDRL